MTHTKTSFYLNGCETKPACSITFKIMETGKLKTSVELHHKKKLLEWVETAEALFQDFKAELLEATK